MRFKTPRRRGVVLGFVGLLAIAAAALAYWTIGGSGAGSGQAGEPSAITVNQTTTLDAMYPGDSAQTLSGTFDNGNDGPVHVGTVTVSIASVTKALDAPTGTCDATDFTLSGAAMTVDAQVPVGSAQGSWSGATIKFTNKATNQDACQGATVNLAYAVS